MADINSTTSAASIADDIRTAITPSYQVEALLQGALKLLEDHAGDDPEIWAAVNILEAAFDSVKKIHAQYDDLNIGKRITALSAAPMDEVAAGARKPGQTTENTEGATNRYDLACDMSGELHTLRDLLEIAADRAYAGKDGKLVSLFVSAIPRMSRAMEICERLEVSHG